MKSKASKWLALLLAVVMVMGIAACSSESDGESNSGNQTTQEQVQSSETESDDGVLVSEGMMDIQYAQQFTIEKFQGGYRLVTDHLSGNRILVVPEAMDVPSDLDADIQILQLPVTNAYICGTNVVNMCDAIGAIDKVTLVGADSTWRFQSIQDQIDSGHTQFAGGYTTDPDYEIIGTAGTQLAVWNGYDEEVFQKLRELNICAIAEENTNEPGLYGRMEWMRCLGVLLGVEDQAEAYYADQMDKIEAIRTEESTGLIVGMGGVSASSGKCWTRKQADFQADYIRYAGGIYNLEDLEVGNGGSLELTPEDFYLRFKDVDVLIWSNAIPTEYEQETMEDLLAAYPAIADFKAYQNDQIYTQSDSYIQTGAGNPYCVVNDIHTILTSDDPDVTTDHIIRLPWASDLTAAD